MDVLTDDSRMPWGQYAGQKMIDVPGKYLMWIHTNMDRNQNNKNVHDYIVENLDVIKKECGLK